MKKIIIASHHKMAEGLKDTLNYIIPNTIEIIDINAYMDNQAVEDQINKELSRFDKSVQIFIFTDLLSGSVNQAFARKLQLYNIELISGVNLPLIMSIILPFSQKDLSKDEIRNLIEESKKQIVYVNDLVNGQAIDDDDE